MIARLPRARLAALCGLLLVAGCATAPFPEPAPYAPAATVPAAEVPARFAARLAPRFEQVNAVVFRFWTRQVTALGVVAVDATNRSFAVTCMNPIGVRLFDLVCDQGRVEGRFAHPEMAKRGEALAQAAGADLAHAYFDWLPPDTSRPVFRDGRLVFAAPDATGVTEYGYAGPDGHLAEKIRRQGGKRLWSVAYRGYTNGAGGLVPTALVIDNRQFGYRLVVTAREETRAHERPAGQTPPGS